MSRHENCKWRRSRTSLVTSWTDTTCAGSTCSLDPAQHELHIPSCLPCACHFVPFYSELSSPTLFFSRICSLAKLSFPPAVSHFPSNQSHCYSLFLTLLLSQPAVPLPLTQSLTRFSPDGLNFTIGTTRLLPATQPYCPWINP